MAAIDVADLRMDYGDMRAVDGLSFSVEQGEVFALVGPNGAGKTTTVEILEGYRRRTGGSVSVLGLDPEAGGRAYRERIGIVLQEAGMDDEFSPRELLRLYAGFYVRPRDVDEVIALVGLEEKADVRTKALSGGQRRRLDLALGLVGDPELLFLDEPTTGFDPSARRRAWEVVSELCSLGKTILLTTHYMDEAHALADRVGVIARGRLVALGTPSELVGTAARSGTTIAFELPRGLEAGELPLPAQRDGDAWSFRSEHPTSDLRTLTTWALERGIELSGLAITRPSFEDAYLDLVAAAEREEDG